MRIPFDYHTNKKLTDFGYENPLGDYKMKIKAEKSVKLEDGKYTGKIIDVKEREVKDYSYVDIIVQEDNNKDFKLQTSFPANLTELSGLGRLFTKLTGKSIEAGKEYDLDELIGLKISFMIANTETDKGTFANIVRDTIKLS